MFDNMYIYSAYDDNTDVNSYGIVVANSVDEAREKVIKAYKKHRDRYADEWEIIITKVKDSGGWFEDCPDILEVC